MMAAATAAGASAKKIIQKLMPHSGAPIRTSLTRPVAPPCASTQRATARSNAASQSSATANTIPAERGAKPAIETR